MAPSKTALILPGGGSRGIFQCGQLIAFNELKLDYDLLITSSVGTLNGLMYHAGKLEELTDLWLTIKQNDVYSDLGIIDFALCYKRKYLHSSKPLKNLLEKCIDYDSLVTNTRRMIINTTDLTNKCSYSREVSSLIPEELLELSLASASPPVHFPLVEFEGRLLCDSGVVDNFGITDAISLGCTNLIMLLPSRLQLNPCKDIIDILESTIALSMNCDRNLETRCINKVNQIIDSIQAQVKPKRINLTTVVPDINASFSFLDFSFKRLDRAKLLEEGYNHAYSVLKNVNLK